MKEKSVYKILLGIAFFVIMIFPEQISSAEEIKPVKIDEKHFPDENLRWEIREAYDKNKDGMLSKKEIKKAKEFCITNYDTLEPYLNLSGIEYLPYITSVDVGNYRIKQKDLNKYPFTKAKKINLTDNHLKNMDFSACKELEELECCSQSELKKIKITKNRKLKKLYLEQCSKLKNVDVSKNDKLEKFWLDENHVQEAITLNGVKSLKFLKISHSQITGLRVKNCPKLKEVVMNFTPKATTLSLQNCPNVRRMYIGAPITELNVSHKDALKELEIAKDNIQIEDFMKYRNLESLGIYDAQIQELNANPWKKLKKLSVDWCTSLKSLNISELDNLEYLDANETALTSIDLSGKIELKRVNCFNGHLEELNLTGVDNLKKVLSFEGDAESYILKKNPLKKIILDTDISKNDLEYIKSQLAMSNYDLPELVFV